MEVNSEIRKHSFEDQIGLGKLLLICHGNKSTNRRAMGFYCDLWSFMAIWDHIILNIIITTINNSYYYF